MKKEKRTADEMFPVVEEYLTGELTQREFSAEHGVSIAVAQLLAGQAPTPGVRVRGFS